ncbi:MAG: invasion associated locus B family protein [Proteobacteria bacterium]|nr:invasion associated locus B family protein [Pseudomonadota bacterium]
MTRIQKLFIALILPILLSSNAACAQEFRGTFADWSVFSIRQDNKEICYMVSLPVQKEGDYNKRGEPYFVITNIDNNAEEISISSGYIYKKHSEVELSFGLKKFNIFTYDNLAWAHSRIDDIEIIKEMRRGESVVVTGKSANNTTSMDTYSLIGFIKAYNRMKTICHKEVEKEKGVYKSKPN